MKDGISKIAAYGPLHVSFAAVDAHSSAALIQEESEEALRAAQLLKRRAPCAGTGPRLGPGTYSDNDLVLRSRPDRLAGSAEAYSAYTSSHDVYNMIYIKYNLIMC